MKRALLVGLLLVGLVAGTGVGAAANVTPNLSATLPQNTVAPGQETSLSVSITNAPQIDEIGASPQSLTPFTTATYVRATMKSGDAPITVETATQTLGAQAGQSRMAEGTTLPARFRVTVDKNAKPGNYTVPVQVTYLYTQTANSSVVSQSPLEFRCAAV